MVPLGVPITGHRGIIGPEPAQGSSVQSRESTGTAAETLANDGILLGYTDMQMASSAARFPRQQTELRVAHADEVETSIMLYVDPSAVDMRKAVAEYGPGSGPLTRQKGAPGVYSATGVLGDPTLATREKGAVLVETLVTNILADIETVRKTPLPQRSGTPSAAGSSGPQPVRPEQVQPNGCTPGNERGIRLLGPLFSSYWGQMDVVKLADLFTGTADIRHPDGVIERGPAVIRQNRAELFSRPAYRGSVHQVSLNDIRCLGPNHAIADGKWELRLVDSAGTSREAAPPRLYKGWCTLVLTGGGGQWSIEAWRYTIDPPGGTPAPTTLKQPGFLGRQDR